MKYDILIIGGGPGGYVAAIKASQLGAKVALIEKHKIGGICLNYGCIPTKSYFKSAKVYDFLKNSSNFGLKSENCTFDWSSILYRKNNIVKKLTSGVSFLLNKNKIDVFFENAEVLSSHEVKIKDKILFSDKLIIATGSSAIIPPIPGALESFKNKYLFTSNELVNLDVFPKKIVIIGGGIIGVEFASIFNKFGSEVVIIEKQDSILNNMDKDIINKYTQILTKSNIKILVNSQVNRIEDNNVFYSYKKDNQEINEKVQSDIILMAVGTRPNLDSVKNLNLKLNNNGIETDEFLRTSVENVYAIGDVNGKYMLAHVASHEGIIAVSHALNSISNIKPMNYDHVPSCVYGFPEIASIGKTEEQVKKMNNINYKTFKFPVSAIGKALADGETEGFAKVIINKDNFKILGMHILAYSATELISEIAVTMELGGTAYDIIHTIHPHPTLSELNLETFLGVIDKPIHY
ncbi:MAG: dihydrolipoamide dehydrogenase [Candidatus Phytoplasma cynodontis]|uniref:dihydrolipoyl dehydrogenase n=1 Tax='Cynodon dactylon' phytoplasma TaxID=295320 RepID=UPI001265CDBA|nr:dihydrolipoyl dehydrogenase ['Cynodon dactylon' phytoplasma]KAB8122045.1 dihydrolipoyl dehydrogenase ['Cynodon dactylon' phytoplasma]WIA07537.1 MAG: dihydrolipoamide dehydrogenase [Candidatus Phytoplasma cynodontis]